MKVKTVRLSLVEHKGEMRIKVKFMYDEALIGRIGKVDGRKWSKTMRAWHIPFNRGAYEALRAQIDPTGIDVGFDPVLLEKIRNNEWPGESYPVSTVPSSESGGYQEEPLESMEEASVPCNDRAVEWVYMNKELVIDQVGKGHYRIYVPVQRERWRARVKELNAFWRPSGKYWELENCPLTEEAIRKFIQEVKKDKIKRVDPPAHRRERKGTEKQKRPPTTSLRKPVLNQEQKRAVSQLENKLTLKRYSYNTLKAYRNWFVQFLQFHAGKDPEKIEREDIETFLLYLIKRKKVSESGQNQAINAIKFYYESVLGRSRETYYVTRPKKPKKYPNILTEEEISVLLNAVDNLKHRCILMAIYSAGLRLSEVVNLRKEDIHPHRNCIHIRGGKGKKDRYTLLSPKFYELLQKYYREYLPEFWVFEGRDGGQYSKRSVQAVFKKALKRSRIDRNATVHTLRHSFATHLIQRGVDSMYVKDLLGHASIKTTEIYSHLTEIDKRKLQSPLENLDI